MLRETILQLSKAAEARKPALLVKIAAASDDDAILAGRRQVTSQLGQMPNGAPLPPAVLFSSLGLTPPEAVLRRDFEDDFRQRDYAQRRRDLEDWNRVQNPDRGYDAVEEIRGRGSRERTNRNAVLSAKEQVAGDNADARLRARQMETDRAPVDSRSDSAIMTQQGLRQTTPDPLPSWLTPVGYGAGAGALAGIPLGLLYRAIFSDEEDKNLSGYLRSALLGGLIGGGIGGLGGAGARALYQNSPTGSYAIDQVLGRLPSGMAERSLGALQEE